MWKKVQRFMEQHHMVGAGEPVIVGLSGGADSVFLLAVLRLLSLRDDGIPMRLKAVHIHHGLRGEEADRDGDFCKELCESWEIPFELVYQDVAGFRTSRRISTEEAGRILRYQVLEEKAKNWNATAIALAHHMDDQAETVVHHLARGSGLKGLGGMRPVHGMRIRPLLCVRREEICTYLREQSINWCEDSSNISDCYTRNRIRSQILPLLKREVNEGVVEHIQTASTLIAQADIYLEGVAEGLWKQLGNVEYKVDGQGVQSVSITLSHLLEQAPIIRTYLLRYMLMMVKGRQQDMTYRHYVQMEELLTRIGPGKCDLPGNLVAVREYYRFWIGNSGAGLPKEEERIRKGWDLEVEIPLPKLGAGEIRVENLVMQAFYREEAGEIPKNQYTKWFDYDKIEGVLWARRRQPGDFILLPEGGRKSVARYMIDEKIPKELREDIPILAEKNQVLWIIGYRISEYYKITETTSRILQVSVDGGEKSGR